MSRSMRPRLLFAVACLWTASAWGVPITTVIPYTFVNIADDSGPLTFAASDPDLNNEGRLAFRAFDDAGFGVILASDGSDLVTIATGPQLSFSSEVTINDSGVAAFYGSRNGVPGVFVGDGGALRTALDETSELRVACCDASINNFGTVAFVGTATDRQGVYTVDVAGNVTAIASSSSFASFAGLAFSDFGTVAFVDQHGDGGSSLLTGNGSTLTTILDSRTSDLWGFHLSERCGINNLGTVAFRAQVDSGGMGLFTSDTSSGINRIDPTGAFSFFSAPCINDSGELAYIAGTTGQQGVYLSNSTEPVIAVGMPLFGSILRSFVGGISFNNDGQIAFEYLLDDGRRGVARADAVSASSLLQTLLADVTGIGPGGSLATKVVLAQTYYAVPDVQSTCAVLTDFVSQVNAQSGKKYLTSTEAAALSGRAQQIMLAIPCE